SSIRAARDAERTPDDAADAVGADQSTAVPSAGGALHDDPVPLDAHADDANPVADAHAARCRDACQRVIVFDTPHHTSDALAPDAHIARGKRQRYAVDGDGRDVDADADAHERLVGARADASGTEFFARIALFFQDHHASAAGGIGMAKKERGG